MKARELKSFSGQTVLANMRRLQEINQEFAERLVVQEGTGYLKHKGFANPITPAIASILGKTVEATVSENGRLKVSIQTEGEGTSEVEVGGFCVKEVTPTSSTSESSESAYTEFDGLTLEKDGDTFYLDGEEMLDSEIESLKNFLNEHA